MLKVLLFNAADQRWAVRVAEVREVLRAVAITRLPGLLGAVEGVVNVRGSIVPVVDLRRRLSLAPRAVEPQEQFVLVTAGERPLLIRTDGVHGVTEIDLSSVQDAAPLLPGVRHVSGLATLPDGIALIQDLADFLAPAEADALSVALQELDAVDLEGDA